MRRPNTTDFYIKILVSTLSGPKLVLTKALISSIPPKLSNLFGFDLSLDEISLFSQFTNSAYYTALLNNTGIPSGLTVTSAQPNAPYAIAPQPDLYSSSATTIPGIYNALNGSSMPLAIDIVKSNILNAIAKLNFTALCSFTNTTPPKPSVRGPTFIEYRSHTPFALTVSLEGLGNGFYDKVNALQGGRTWWTGAAWQTHDSASLWNFTEVNVLPDVIASLG